MARARIAEFPRLGFWIAQTFTTGWPRGKLRAWAGPNETEPRVKHIGLLALGYSLEVRFGPLE